MTEVFAGVRVIELAQYVFVPACGALLADQGAEIIKIETPGRGDPYRTLKVGDGRETAAANLSMEQNNRGKKSVTLDLKSPEGREALLRLVETADVFLTSLRPRALTALRLDPADVQARNPRIIYARGNGLGFNGAEADKAGYDASAFWARGGFADLLTPPDAASPIRSRPAMGDHAGAISLAMGVASALFKRERTGEGTVVETSLLQNAAWILSSDIVVSQAVKSYDSQSAYHQAARFPLMRAYATQDGRWIQLMLLAPDQNWPELCELLDLPLLKSDPRFVNNEARMANGAELAAILGERIGSKPWSSWQASFDAWNAPWELVKTIEEVGSDPQVLANDVLFDLYVNEDTPVRVVAGPVCFNGRARPLSPQRSPHLGEHNAEILGAIGYEPTRQRAG